MQWNLQAHDKDTEGKSFVQFVTCFCWVALQHESKSESHSVMSNSLRPHGLYSSWNSPGQNTGVGSSFLLQVIFPTQGLNPGVFFPLVGRFFTSWAHQGSPRIPEWVAYPFCGSSQPRNQTGVSCIAGEFFTSWATREAPSSASVQFNSVSHSVVSDSLRPHKSQLSRPPCCC